MQHGTGKSFPEPAEMRCVGLLKPPYFFNTSHAELVSLCAFRVFRGSLEQQNLLIERQVKCALDVEVPSSKDVSRVVVALVLISVFTVIVPVSTEQLRLLDLVLLLFVF